MASKPTEKGFYWIRFWGKWLIAYYDPERKGWKGSEIDINTFGVYDEGRAALSSAYPEGVVWGERIVEPTDGK